MTRTILDHDFRRWEAYATTGAFGLPAPAGIAFRCTSDGGVRPRVHTFEGDKSEAERAVVEVTPEELLRMLEAAPEVR